MNYKIKLQGLHCEACKKIAEKRIGKLKGVGSVNVDLNQQTVLVQSNRSLSQTEIEGVLKDTEYKIIAFLEV
ncbi:MAG: heavy metal-associated domain-containing protein [Patescibacteria group bacterium]